MFLRDWELKANQILLCLWIINICCGYYTITSEFDELSDDLTLRRLQTELKKKPIRCLWTSRKEKRHFSSFCNYCLYNFQNRGVSDGSDTYLYSLTDVFQRFSTDFLSIEKVHVKCFVNHIFHFSLYVCWSKKKGFQLELWHILEKFPKVYTINKRSLIVKVVSSGIL